MKREVSINVGEFSSLFIKLKLKRATIIRIRIINIISQNVEPNHLIDGASLHWGPLPASKWTSNHLLESSHGRSSDVYDGC